MNETSVDRGGVDSVRHLIDRPILVVSTPRSGSTLLFETLAKAPCLFTTGGESHSRIEQIADFFPPRRGWSSNRLDREDATPAAIEALARQFYPSLRDRDGQPASGPVRMLEKTPKNALRVPFFSAAWEDSLFIYLYRDPRPTLASMIDAWLSGRFVTYPRLPGWGHPRWSLLLVPGWQDLIGRSLGEIVARQWAITTEILVDDLSQIARDRVVALDYDEFLKSPQPTIARLTKSLNLAWDATLGSELPLSRYTRSRPDPEKWRNREGEIEAVMPLIQAIDAKARNFLASTRV